jgi:hypothetical protein
MATLPRNVFTTCPKEETRRVVVPKVEYRIYNGSKVFGPEILMVVEGEITLEHIKKAAKCGNFEKYYVTKTTDNVELYPSDLPIKANLIIEPEKIVEREYTIFDGASGRALMIVKDAIKIDDVKKAVKCAGIDKFEAYATMAGTTVRLTGGNYPVQFHVSVWSEKPYLKRTPEVFHICESTSVAPVKKTVFAPKIVEKEYKIIDGASGRSLMICKNEITYEDAKNAAKCAKVNITEAIFIGSLYIIAEKEDFPAHCDITLNRLKNVKRTPEVFHICESTSVAPVKKTISTPVVKVSAKRKFIKAAIKGLSTAIEALNELEKII